MGSHLLFQRLDSIAPQDQAHIMAILGQYDTHLASRTNIKYGRSLMLHSALRLADEPRIDSAPQVSSTDLVSFFEQMVGTSAQDK